MTECGLTNLAICLPEKAVEFVMNILNLAIEPLLNLNHTLLTEPVNITIFQPLWAVIVYVLSLFYGLFFLFAGFNFLISGYDAAKRERAKEWFWNIVLMVIFVQASFLIYGLLLEMQTLLTAGIINIIDPNFFLMTADNIVNVGLQILLLLPYLAVLLITVLLLALRYLFVSVGVVFLPMAIFLYFIPPLQSYGKLIINVLVVTLFVPFFSAVILFGASALLQIPLFQNYKIVLVTVAYLSVSLFMLLLLLFAIAKAALSVLNSDIGRSAKLAAKYLI